ncbi:MAG: hypothetical protein ACREXR_08520 [Gammaproteobacteria bacterium]
MFDINFILIKTFESIATALILFLGFGGPAVYFLRREFREKSDKLIDRLGEIFELKLHDIVSTAGSSLEGIRSDIRAGLNRVLGPLNEEYFAQGVTKKDTEYVRKEIKEGRADELFLETEKITDVKARATRYKEIVGVCLSISDRLNTIQALNRYKALAGKTATSSQLAGYVYWWFRDVDTAIVETETALEIAKDEGRKGRGKKEELYEIQNNLAFYYAEKGIKKEIALALVEDTLHNISEGHKDYEMAQDTAGYVYLRFASSEAEIQKAVEHFDAALRINPKSKEATQHLIEAYEKRKEILEKENDEDEKK